MVRFLRAAYTLHKRPHYRRKLLLFACAGCTRHLKLVEKKSVDERLAVGRRLVALGERIAEWVASRAERKQAKKLVAECPPGEETYYLSLASVAVVRTNPWDAALDFLNAGYWATFHRLEPVKKYLRAQCSYLCDIFGNPFQEPSAEPAWLLSN